MNTQHFKTLRIAGALILAGLVSGQIMAQTNSTATAGAETTIVSPIVLIRIKDMNFGKVIPNGNMGGTVVLAANGAGTRTATNVEVFQNSMPGESAAEFQVSGQSGHGYTITLPSANVTLSNGDGGSITVNAFTSSKSDEQGNFDAGAENFYVGATLNVGAAQAAGTYSGSISVSVAYN